MFLIDRIVGVFARDGEQHPTNVEQVQVIPLPPNRPLQYLRELGNSKSDATTTRRHTSGFTWRSDTLSRCTAVVRTTSRRALSESAAKLTLTCGHGTSLSVLCFADDSTTRLFRSCRRRKG